MIRLLRAVLFLAAFLPLPLTAAPDEAVIGGLYARGLAGDKRAVVDCIAALEQALARQPNDQLARVYLGSAYTLRSRDLPFFGTAKLTALRHGIALMDEAADAAPNDARVQLLRALTNEALPTLLGRRQSARQALDRLVATIEMDPGKLKPSDQQLLYLNAGEAAERAGEKARAAELWRRGGLLKADPKLRQEIESARAALN
ncbi:MAG: hypothetical protein H0X34_18220 [Chthoniobacterales bacterium]|nr:hypothetical protein [Chthoniobacterales bacterium]